MILTRSRLLDAAPVLKAGGLAVIPTDTIYGIVCSALQPRAVEGLYEVRQRDPQKACILLIADIDQLQTLGVRTHRGLLEAIQPHWPGPVSVIIPAPDDELAYLHRGQMSLAIRLPDHDELRELIREAGPLLAPSANLDGQPPAETAAAAQAVFGDRVDIYIEAGPRIGEPSRIIIPGTDGTYTVVRG